MIIILMKKNRSLPIIFALMLAGSLALSGCSASNTSSSSSKPTEQVKIMTSFYPLQFVTQRIMGDAYKVSSITPSGGEPHDVELTPKDVTNIGQSDLVVYLKGFQPAVDKAVTEAKPKHVIEVSEPAKLIAATEEAEHEADHNKADAKDEKDHEHGKTDAKDEKDHEHGHDHGHGNIQDPHFWLDPQRMLAVAQQVKEALVKQFPNQEKTFTDNFSALKADLEKLDQEYQQGLKTCEHKTIVTAHTAFQYLANTYNLKQLGISGVDPEAEPAPARLAEIKKQLENTDVTTIFSEELLSPKVAEALAKELNLKTAVLNPIESQNDKRSYLDMMRDNLKELRTALACK